MLYKFSLLLSRKNHSTMLNTIRAVAIKKQGDKM
jgi:hypothetical protein